MTTVTQIYQQEPYANTISCHKAQLSKKNFTQAES